MNNRALVVGTVAYDLIFGIHGDIRKEIIVKNGKVGRVNLMFTAKGKQKYYGGTAGNIAYGLALLRDRPILFSVAGKDFSTDYEPYLKKLKIKLRVIKKEGFTPTFYGISDEVLQQIGIWQPNVYADFSDKTKLKEGLKKSDYSLIKVSIFSPGTGISTRNHMKELRKKLKNKVTIIFDPSQVLSIFYDKKLLLECLSLADIFIGNETEIAQLKNIFGLGTKDVLNLGLKAIIETRGEDGCLIHQKDLSPIKIEAIKPKKVTETTGAGDAFRAGLIHGLLKNKSLEESCRFGAFMGAKSVEEKGGQLYTTTKKELINKIKNLK
ncbi:MAG: PfkB family carbohydrate kinase [Candidatus Shapirobacteria bacterium]|nr:PfkB family carbohydrate kinase [Candidatus Shapirobacteria bacterium]